MSNKFSFTKSKIDELKPSKKRVRYYDTKVSGLSLEVTPAGRKSFRVYKRLKHHSSPINITLGVFPETTIEQARLRATEAMSLIAAGKNPILKRNDVEKKKVILAKVLEDYLANKNLKDSTIVGYQQVVTCYLKDWQNIPLDSISEEMVKVRNREISKRSEAQANYTMRVLRALFNFAKFEYRTSENDPIFTNNPVKIISQLREWNRIDRKQTKIPNSQLSQWFKAIKLARESGSETMQVICDFLEITVLTGLRKMELLTLKWSHVNFTDRTFFISETKNHHALELPISDYCLSIFERRFKYKNNAYVFNTNNAYGYVREPKKNIKKIIELAGFYFMIHDLRRTHTTTAENLGLGLYTIKRLLNHKTNRNDVTAGYTILTAEELREPAQKIEDKILQNAGILDTEKNENDIMKKFIELSPLKQKSLLYRMWKGSETGIQEINEQVSHML